MLASRSRILAEAMKTKFLTKNHTDSLHSHPDSLHSHLNSLYSHLNSLYSHLIQFSDSSFRLLQIVVLDL